MKLLSLVESRVPSLGEDHRETPGTSTSASSGLHRFLLENGTAGSADAPPGKAGIRTRGRCGCVEHRAACRPPLPGVPRSSSTHPVLLTTFVPTHRCGAVPDSHRVPSSDTHHTLLSNTRFGRGMCTFHSCKYRERLFGLCNPARPLLDAPPIGNLLTWPNITALTCITRKIPVLVFHGRSSHDERGETLVKKQSRPTMAPAHPLITVTAALAALLGMFFLAVQSSGPVTSDGAQGAVEDTAPEETEPLPAEGEPDGQTVVPAEVVEGLEEVELTHESDLTTQVNYPRLPHTEPLSDFLDHTLTTEIDAFAAANPEASSYKTTGQLTAAHDDLLGVRLISTETDSEGSRECYSTYWYDTESGTVTGSSFLLDGQEHLEELNTLVRED